MIVWRLVPNFLAIAETLISLQDRDARPASVHR